MNRPSLEKFAPVVKAGGVVLINSTLIPVRTKRDDVDELAIPVNDLALAAGSVRSANVVALAAFVARSGVVPLDALRQAVEKEFARKAKLIPINMDAFDRGVRAARTGSSDT
jgi:2-oxoglutarate ferredoxin oxidoreductase subunit gamma